MKEILKELTIIPGVAGVCLQRRDHGIACLELRTGLEADRIETVSQQLFRLVRMADLIRIDLDNVSFLFSSYVFVLTVVDRDNLLLTLCEPGSNCSLVRTTASLLCDDLLRAIEAGELDLGNLDLGDDDEEEIEELHVLEEVEDDDLEDVAAGLEDRIDAEEEELVTTVEDNDVAALSALFEELRQKKKVRHRGQEARALARLIEDIRKEYAYFVGPAAAIFMRDHERTWRQRGEANRGRLPELIRMLCAEITDPAMAREFQERARAVLAGKT